MCNCLARGGVGGEWIRGLGLGFNNPVGPGVVLDGYLGFSGMDVVGGYGAWTRVWRGGVVYVCVSSDYLCRWQVQVSVYCARRIPAHLRCTQCSILLHRINICFIPCICLCQISQIQTCLCVVVGPGFVSTSPAFMRRSAPSSGSACPINRAPIDGGWRFRHNLHSNLPIPL